MKSGFGTGLPVSAAAAPPAIHYPQLLDRQKRKTRTELANAIFDYIEILHNRQRRARPRG